MLEFTMCKLPKVDNGDYTYVKETALAQYASLKSALGLLAGTWVSDSAWLEYSLGGKACYVSKRCVCNGITFNVLYDRGLVEGVTITLGGKQYLCRFIRGAAPAYLNAMPNIADYGSYPANEVFSKAEFMRLFAPILNKTGNSVDGIPFGTHAKFTPQQLGFQVQTAGNSTMCAEHNATMQLMRGSTDETFACVRSRTQMSMYWGFRPILIEI